LGVSIDSKYLEREKEIIAKVAKEFKIPHVEPTPTRHRVDGLFMTKPQGEITHMIEVKSRNIKSDAYKTTKIEMGKWKKLNQFNLYVPTLLAIGWTDRTGYVMVGDVTPAAYTLMNRRVIRQASDWQIAVEIDVSDFTFIK
jgi:hypothetical protein